MGRNRRRLIAASIIGSTAVIATVAASGFTVTSNPGQSRQGVFNAPMRVIVSVRNTTPTPITISDVIKHNPQLGACLGKMTIAPLMGGFPMTIQPGAQAQFVASSGGSGFSMADVAAGDPSCIWEIVGGGSGSADLFTTTFHVGSAPSPAFDPQPIAINFGTPMGFETQQMNLVNYTSSPFTITTANIADPTGSVTFVGGACDGMQVCPGLTIPAMQFIALPVKCAPKINGPFSGTIDFFGASAKLATSTFTCDGAGSGSGSGQINIQEAQIDIRPAMGTEGTATANIDFVGSNDTMTTADISTSAFHFTDPMCGPQHCTFTPPRLLPGMLQVACTPPGSGTNAAVLSVKGNNGSGDIDSANLTCAVGSSGPQISVPGSVDAGLVDVNTTSGPVPLTITNNGTATLVARITTVPPHWTADSCALVDCNIGSGSSQVVDLHFMPDVHGFQSDTLSITSNAGGKSVTVMGTGRGGVLTVTDPTPPFDIDFGTIGRNQLASITVSVADTGNAGIMVNIGNPGAPFGVTTPLLNVNAGDTSMFDVTCQSATPIPSADSMVSLTSSAYTANTNKLTVHCAIAQTNVQVTPQPLDFDEVFVSAAAPTKLVTVKNPGPGNVTIEKFALDHAKSGISLSPPNVSAPTQLTPNQTITATLELATGAETDVAGTDLVVTVDGEDLTLPVTGVVVTPKAHVAPAELDLGTACIGSQVTGSVMMVNDGTARLTMQAPVMDQSFTPLFQSPTTYPSQLLAGTTALVGITPSSSATGPIKGTLTWDVNVPDAPFSVPVNLSFIAAGTAISPSQLAFGSLDVDAKSAAQTITLQNCNTVPVVVTINGVVADRGPASAWDVVPRTDQRALGPRDKMTIAARFQPTKLGRHSARIQLDVDGTAHEVELVGDAIGIELDKTSFYDCNCSGPSAPERGWPIVAALALLLRRRRRRSRRG